MALGDGKRGWLGTESVGCLESCPSLPAPLRLASLAPPGPPGLWSSLVPPCFCRPLLFGSPFSTLHFLSSTSSPALSKQNHLCSIGFSGKSFLDLSLIIALEQRTRSSQAPPLWAWSPAGLGKGRPWRKGLHPAWPAASASLLSCRRPTCGPLVGQLRCSLTVGSPERLGARASQAPSCSSCRGFTPQDATRRVLRKHNPGGNVCHFLC